MIPLNAISWFEIPVLDFERAKRFYSTLFNYEMPEFPMANIRMGILPHEQDKGGIGGAICLGEGYEPSSGGVKVYLPATEDISVMLARVAPAGGEVVLPKTLIDESSGYFALFIDTEGNQIGLHSQG